MQRDRYGLPLSTASEAAASAYGDGFDRLLAAWNGAEEVLDRAPSRKIPTLRSPTSPALVCMQSLAMVHKLAPTLLGHANLLPKRTDRERGHVHVIASAIEGNAAQALADAER